MEELIQQLERNRRACFVLGSSLLLLGRKRGRGVKERRAVSAKTIFAFKALAAILSNASNATVVLESAVSAAVEDFAELREALAPIRARVIEFNHTGGHDATEKAAAAAGALVFVGAEISGSNAAGTVLCAATAHGRQAFQLGEPLEESLAAAAAAAASKSALSSNGKQRDAPTSIPDEQKPESDAPLVGTVGNRTAQLREHAKKLSRVHLVGGRAEQLLLLLAWGVGRCTAMAKERAEGGDATARGASSLDDGSSSGSSSGGAQAWNVFGTPPDPADMVWSRPVAEEKSQQGSEGAWSLQQLVGGVASARGGSTASPAACSSNGSKRPGAAGTIMPPKLGKGGRPSSRVRRKPTQRKPDDLISELILPKQPTARELMIGSGSTPHSTPVKAKSGRQLLDSDGYASTPGRTPRKRAAAGGGGGGNGRLQRRKRSAGQLFPDEGLDSAAADDEEYKDDHYNDEAAAHQSGAAALSLMAQSPSASAAAAAGGGGDGADDLEANGRRSSARKLRKRRRVAETRDSEAEESDADGSGGGGAGKEEAEAAREGKDGKQPSPADPEEKVGANLLLMLKPQGDNGGGSNAASPRKEFP